MNSQGAYAKHKTPVASTAAALATERWTGSVDVIGPKNEGLFEVSLEHGV